PARKLLRDDLGRERPQSRAVLQHDLAPPVVADQADRMHQRPGPRPHRRRPGTLRPEHPAQLGWFGVSTHGWPPPVSSPAIQPRVGVPWSTAARRGPTRLRAGVARGSRAPGCPSFCYAVVLNRSPLLSTFLSWLRSAPFCWSRSTTSLALD